MQAGRKHGRDKMGRQDGRTVGEGSGRHNRKEGISDDGMDEQMHEGRNGGLLRKEGGNEGRKEDAGKGIERRKMKEERTDGRKDGMKVDMEGRKEGR
jgi:hypothetical protein